MSLNIKNPETYRLAKELAFLKGLSMTSAITLAVGEELKREKAKQNEAKKKKSRYELLMELTEQTAPLFTGDKTSKELFDELYDPETGLPV